MQTKKIFGISVFIILATIIGVALAIFVFRQSSIYVPLKYQAVVIDLQEPLQAKVKIDDALDIDVSGTIDATIPIKESLDIPLKGCILTIMYLSRPPFLSKTTTSVKETLNIDVQNILSIKIKKGDLEIPLSSIRLNQSQDQPDERAP